MNKNGSFDISKVAQKYNELKSSSSSIGANFLKLENGDNIVRLVLFTNSESGKLELYSEFKQHFINRKSHICPSSLNIDSCPICDFITYLGSQGKQTEAVRKAISLKKKYAFNVVVLDSATKQYKMSILEAGSTLAQDIFSVFADAEYGNIADLNTGRDIKIKKSGSGLETDYSALPSPKVSRCPKADKPPIDLPAYIASRVESTQDLKRVIETEFRIKYSEVQSFLDASKTDYENSISQDTEKETDYSGLSLKELKDIYKERFPQHELSKKITKEKLIELLKGDLPF